MKIKSYTNVEELAEGMILLIGSCFYKVEQITSTGFRGLVWVEGGVGWVETNYTIPIPHPAHLVLEVTERHLFEGV